MLISHALKIYWIMIYLTRHSPYICTSCTYNKLPAAGSANGVGRSIQHNGVSMHVVITCWK